MLLKISLELNYEYGPSVTYIHLFYWSEKVTNNMREVFAGLSSTPDNHDQGLSKQKYMTVI